MNNTGDGSFGDTLLCDACAEKIAYAGLSLSTLGYGIMIATAVIFKDWRSRTINQVWLYMCGANLLFVSSLAFYVMVRCKRVDAEWMDSDLGYTLFWIVSDYFLMAMCMCVLSSAWIAYQQLVLIITDDNIKMWKVLLFASVCPIPLCLLRSIFWKQNKPVNFTRHLVPAVYQVVIPFNKLCSVLLHSHVLYSVCVSDRKYGRKSAINTCVLALELMFISGVQYIIILTINVFYERDSQPNTLLFCIMTGLTMLSVFAYSMLFVVGIKRTRELWFGLLSRTFNKSFKMLSS